MDIFGLTPVDASLSAWGLNVAQSIIEFLFFRTHLGVVAFAIGFFNRGGKVRDVEYRRDRAQTEAREYARIASNRQDTINALLQGAHAAPPSTSKPPKK